MINDNEMSGTPMGRLLWTGTMTTTEGGHQLRLPLGTVTFLLTDIEGSTRHWEAGPDLMREAVIRHYEILDQVVAAHGGVRPEEQGEGDSIVAAFSRASDAVGAALAAQQLFQREAWPTEEPIRVRMAIHTGEAQVRDGSNYVGLAIIRTARLRSIAVGQQVLVSSASRDLALDQLGDAVLLRDLGEHRLKDLARPERVYQLAHSDLAGDFPPLRSLDAVPNNLPIRLSTFVGRSRELSELRSILTDQRLVTVTGSGGAGKTRLALQAAADSVDSFPDGVWWIELAPLTDPSAVVLAVAQVVDARLRQLTEDSVAIATRLGTAQALLIVDNCEHVIGASAELVEVLLQRCPNLTVLATSRTPLEIAGEATWRVPSLALPEPGARVSLTQLSQLDSVRLFADRAREVRPTFTLTDANAPTVAEICHRLDGIPLAIELAAARTKSLPPDQILQGLGDALRLLTGGPRQVLPRQQTLNASIEWSAELLDPTARTLLSRLAVFTGSFDLSSAEAVCAGDGVDEMAVLDALERLLVGSLIARSDSDSAGRFTMLETLRQYGLRQLQIDGDANRRRARHAEHFERVAHKVAPACETDDQDGSIAAIADDYANLRASLHWLLELHEGERLAAVVVALGSYWDVSGERTDAAYWCRTTLGTIDAHPSALRCRLLALSAESRIQIGEFSGGFEDATAAMDMAAEVADSWGAGRASATLTTIFGSLDLNEWRKRSAATEQLLHKSGDSFSLSRLLTWRGVMPVRRGMFSEGKIAFDAARPQVLASRQPMLIASQRMWEGHLELHTGNLERAEEISREVLRGRALRGAARVAIAESTISWSRAYRFVERDPASVHLDRAAQYREDTDPVRADVLLYLGALELLQEDPAECRKVIDSCHATHERRLPLALAAEGGLAAYAAYALGELDDATERAEAVLGWAAACDSVIDRARATVILGAVALDHGDLPTAERHARDAIADYWAHQNLMGLSDAIELLASIALECGDYSEAAALLGAATAQRAVMGSPRGYLVDLGTDASLRTRQAVGAVAFDAACDAGAELGLAETIAYIDRSRGQRGRPTIGWHSLTPTELRVADLVRTGLTNREIADSLLMGSETVKTHVSHIFGKLGISKRAQLAVLAAEHGAGESTDPQNP
jgi:predicted ATPase/class 3 adenylate cyclase/DNA-binding CsgD family transcriptional regulator